MVGKFPSTLFRTRSVIGSIIRRVRSVPFFTLAVIIGFVGVLTIAEIVAAVREERAYVFPTMVESDGWENSQRALQQDLSREATFTDFYTENSAYIFFGSSTEEVSEEVTVIPEEEGTLPPPEVPVVEEDSSHEEPIPSSLLETPSVVPTPLEENPPLLQSLGIVPLAHAQDLLATSSEEAPSPRCVVRKVACHTMLFSGFSLGGVLDESAFRFTSLTLSLASEFSRAGMLSVSYRADGSWKTAGEISLSEMQSNASRGGYLTFPLPDIGSWHDLGETAILIEYVPDGLEDRETGVLFLDALWIDLSYAKEEEEAVLGAGNVVSGLQAHNLASSLQERTTLDIGERTLVFQEESGGMFDGIEMRVDSASLVGLQQGELYISITNVSGGELVPSISLYGLPDGVVVRDTAIWNTAIPSVRTEPVYGITGYFCDGGWATTTEDGASYRCEGTMEERRCSARNDDLTNCIVEDALVGVEEVAVMKSDWASVSVRDFSNVSPVALLLGSYAAREHIPEQFSGLASIPLDQVLLENETVYLRLSIAFPENTAGTYSLFASGDTGASASLPLSWNGAWTARLPVFIVNAGADPHIPGVLGISIPSTRDDFWGQVRPDGGDIRAIDGRTGEEMPLAITRWSFDTRQAQLWTTLNEEVGSGTSTIYLYVGNPHATRVEDPSAFLVSDVPTPRAFVLGNDVGAVSVDVLTYQDDTRLTVEEEEFVLGHGAVSAVTLHSGDRIFADGPISASVSGGDDTHAVVPLAFVGRKFVLPKSVQPIQISLLATQRDAIVVATGMASGTEEGITALLGGPSVSRTFARGTIILTSDAPIAVAVSAPGGAIPLPPVSREPMAGVSTRGVSIGTVEDNSSYRLRCAVGNAEEKDGRRGGETFVSTACVGGSALPGLFVLDGLSHPASALTEDADDRILSFGTPLSHFSGELMVPFSSDALLLSCAPGDESLWEVRMPDGSLVRRGSCFSTLAHLEEEVIHPADEGPAFPPGVMVRTVGTTSDPVLVFAKKATIGEEIASPVLRPVIGALASTQGGEHTVSFGGLERVFPGDRRVNDIDERGKTIDHVNELLSDARDFAAEDTPMFQFRFSPQTSLLLSGLRETLGMAAFSVEKLSLTHYAFGEINADIEITEQNGNDWAVVVRSREAHLRPGKYTLRITLNDNGEIIEDAFDFYWGVLAINTDRSEYAVGNDALITAAALSNSGNTICDADLKLQITRPDGAIDDLDLPPSGFCNGNNVTAVPDYFVSYTPQATGTYALHLVELDDTGALQNELRDAFTVSDAPAFTISRTGPTRIYPLSPYDMTIRITAREDFAGQFIERLPSDFVVIERANGFLEDQGDHLSATWNLDLKAGETQELTYRFDAPNWSPYRFTVGKASLAQEGAVRYSELRSWQIASDAAGQMLLFWDSGTNIPTGWTCVSCAPADPFYERFPLGSSVYGTTTGSSTHTHTATGTVAQASGGNSENSTVAPLLVAPLDHSHAYDPIVSATTSLPRYRTLRVIRADSAGDPVTIPNGAITIFDVASSSLPTNWYRYDAQDGYFAYASNTIGVISGSSTHTHVLSSSTDNSVGSGLRSRLGGTQVTSANVSHQHTVNATTTLQNHEPPYVEVLFAKLSATSAPANTMVAMWTDEPAMGWQTISNSGQAFDRKMFRGSTTYGGTGGAESHIPDPITATSSTSTVNINARVGATGASATSTHQIDITFGDTANAPPSIEVIIAKRLVGVSTYTQTDYRFYTNTNAITPTDPWPSGGNDLGENEPGVDVTTSIRPTQAIRLRMNIFVGNATATVGSQDWKLQYGAMAVDCATTLNWTDVAPMSSSTALWRGYNNAGVAHNATLPSYLLSTSTIAETYAEENNATTTPVEIPLGTVGEWDWVIQDNIADPNTTYCFRIVKSSGIPLDGYTNYPSILTNQVPDQTIQSAPFDNEAVATTTPWFEFSSTDPEGNDLDYHIQVDDDPNFGLPELEYTSGANPELFDNVPNPANKSPFNAGDTIRYRANLPLTASTTYWWRVRATDPNGSNTYGSWSVSRSVTIDLSVGVARWYQSTDAQFRTDTLYGTEATSSTNNFVTLISGSTTGTTTSSAIDFTSAATGTAWGSVSWNDQEPIGSITYRVEYFTSTGTWARVQNADLAGNTAGFTTSPINLLTVDPSTYGTIRIVADFLGGGGSGPRLLDWTVNWAFLVNTPTLYKLFNNEKTNTTTPSFEFTTTDPQGESLTYEFQWSTDPNFTSSTTRTSDTHSGFQNLTNGGDIDPFTSGNRIRFTIQAGDALTASTTYWWRVRARDPAPGSNIFSFYSEKRSFTVDLSVNVPTWFQTTSGQFDTDGLTGAYTSSALNAVLVSTTTSEAMTVYGEGTVQTPQYRIWDGLAWGNELSAPSINAQVKWVTLRSSPVGGEYLLGTIGSDGDTNVMVYTGGSWDDQFELTNNLSNSDARGIGVAWETLSGEALAVSCDGDERPSYSTWGGASWASVQAVIDFGATTSCEWIRVASDPTSNEVILMMRNTGSRYYAAVWDGSSWGSTTSLGQMIETNNEGMAVEYEESGNQAIIAASRGSDLDFVYNTWNGAVWQISTSTVVRLGDHPEWLELARDVGTDNMAVCYIDNDNDIGVIRWNGSAWVPPTTELDTGGNTKAGRAVDCVYENTPARDGYIMVPYSDTTDASYRYWDGAIWQPELSLSTIQDSYIAQAIRTASNTVMAMFFDDVNTQYDFAYWTGATWSALQTIETSPSDTTNPRRETFMMEAKLPTTKGSVVSTAIDFDDGVAPAWDSVLWSATTTGSSTVAIQVEYYTASGTWELIPDGDLPGNSVGDTSTATPISIINLNTTTYNQIRLKATLTCILGVCPTLNDWTVRWAEGIDLSGTAKQFDLVSNVTSGTVAVAVNGALQTGKSGTISGGIWTIDNVTVFPGNTVTVFIDGALDEAEANTVVRYTGPGNMAAIPLYEQHLTIGSASTTGTTSPIANNELSNYDNSASSPNDEDIFFDVDAGNDLTVCAISGCGGAGLIVNSGTYRPDSTGSGNVTTYDLRNDATLTADGNTLSVGGSWDNNVTFNANTGAVTFIATSGTRTIDSTGATSASFNTVTFGSGSGTAVWNLSSTFTVLGDLTVNFGTLSPGSSTMALEGNMTIGASGGFQKGSATTTFSGSAAKVWTDNTAAKQDLGNILIDGTSKTLQLGSGVRATNITIGGNDTLDVTTGNYTLTVLGYWQNGNIFNARAGTTTFSGGGGVRSINPGASPFHHMSFTGTSTWFFTTSNATSTGDVTVATGTMTLPSGTLAVGGSFQNTGGSFVSGGTTKFTSTASGNKILSGTSTWTELLFTGSGVWTMNDVNATATGNVLVAGGTLTLPTGTFAVGGAFDALGGAFTAGSNTLKFTAAGSTWNVRGNSSSFGSLLFSGGGSWTMLDVNATSTGTFQVSNGTTTLPTGVFVVGGSFVNADKFTHASGTVKMNASALGNSITAGNSLFGNLELSGSSGGWTITGNATTSGNFAIRSAGAFTQTSGTTFEVRGIFTNLVGGASTTWSGARLWLDSGTEYSLNTSASPGDAYGVLTISGNTQVRMWNSTSTTYVLSSSGSLYSQDHNGTNGELYIFGEYRRGSGVDYWNYATDFDGTSLSGGSERQVTVRFASNATSTFSTSTLEILGGSVATTTITNQGAGTYGVILSGGTLNAQYYAFRNLGNQGLQLLATTTIPSLHRGDFELAVNGGTLITMSSTTVDKNQGAQFEQVRFATTTAITGVNVTELGTATSSVRFRFHYGNLSGESFDNDPGGNPGNIRWDDSNYIISISGTVYQDAGVTPLGVPTCDSVTPVVRVKVEGGGSFSAPCSSGVATGTFSVAGVTFTGDVVFTIYLDTAGGARGVVVTKSATENITGLNLYQNRVIVRHEDVTPITIANMNAWDLGDDPDIPFTVSTSGPNTLTVRSDTEFWIWAGKTFVPGGNITIESGGGGQIYDGKFHLDNGAIFTGTSSESHIVGGSWQADSGSLFSGGGSGWTFNGTTTGKLITAVPSVTFNTLTINGAGGSWAISGTFTVDQGLAVSLGTLSGGASMTVEDGGITGNGVIAMTGGTVAVHGTTNFSGNTDWSFYDLKFGNGSTTATTTKMGSSTITTSGILTVSTSSVLKASSTLWVLLGAGTPIDIPGLLDPQLSTFRYATTTAMNIRALSYYRLELRPDGAGNPTYTLLPGTFTVGEDLIIGNGIDPATVTMTTNDPAVTIEGDVVIAQQATLTGSDSGWFGIGGSWLNSGTYSHGSGLVSFISTSTGETIIASTSPFFAVTFDNPTGGWTVSGNATSSGAWTLSRAGSFVLSSGQTLEVDGTFTNQVGGASTTWSGTVLHLNSGTSYTINTKTVGADTYEILRIGTSTDVRMWNSLAATTTTLGTGSLYSQDHTGIDGDLYIWGDYVRASGDDHWSYDTDFDGTALGGASRQVDVRLASGTSVALSGGSLAAVGTSTASTTIDRQGSLGAYALRISGGSTTMRYYEVRNTDGNGVDISGTPIISTLSDGAFEVVQGGGVGISVAGSVIDANPLKIFFRNRFATTTAITAYNVRATGSSTSAWRFSQHVASTSINGNLGGEYYDDDPGGDPGLLIWDDSAANITISGVVYRDAGTTLIGSPTCDGSTLNVRLRVQGAGNYAVVCNAGTSVYTIPNVIFNPGDTLTVFLDTGGAARGVAVSVDPATNINNMDIYQDTVILRNEGLSGLTIADIDEYDFGDDPDIPFISALGVPDTISVFSGTELRVWNGKTFAPGGNVTVHANASSTDNKDGSLVVESSAVFAAAGTETHTIGGKFSISGSGTFTSGNSTIFMNATTTGKTLSPSISPFYNLSFIGGGGGWSMGAFATTTNNLSISAGAVTLPSTLLAVGSSFTSASPGSFDAGGNTVKFFATTAGKNIQQGTSTWANLEFIGVGGGWTFLDANATSTGSIIIATGTVVLPAGTLAVTQNFQNTGGVFTANQSSSVKLIATSSTSTVVRAGGPSFGNLLFTGGATWMMTDTHATTTGSLRIISGTTTLPSGILVVGGSFANSDKFSHASGTVKFNATSTGHSVTAGNSLFAHLEWNGIGGWTVGDATSTGSTTIRAAGTFIQSSGTTLEVRGLFTNLVGGGATTWTGSRLAILSGGSAGSYTVNTKAAGGDVYNILRLGTSTELRSWNSSASSYELDPTSSLYSQDHAGVDGNLYVFGEYRRTSGTDHWSYATDFDGAALGGSPRAVTVRYAAGASSTFQNATLNIVGASGATTTVTNQGSGVFTTALESTTLNANYYAFRNMATSGLQLLGTTTLQSFQNGDFELAINGGTAVSIASTTIDQNASSFITRVRFATTTSIGGTNIRRIGTSSSAITFQNHYGNLDGESFDDDGDDGCGQIRWDDSSCLFVDQSHYRWRNDDGGEGVPASEWFHEDWSKRRRVIITNDNASTFSNFAVKFDVGYDGDMQADFDDARFTDASGTTTISYWFEEVNASATSTVWVEVPNLLASGETVLYMYYGNGTAVSTGSGTTTFPFFDDFEDNNISEYSGDTSLFSTSATFNYERTRGLGASSGNQGAQTTDGIGRDTVSVGQGSTLRFFQYIDPSAGPSNEPCTLFGVQSPFTDNDNYAVCLEPFGTDHVGIYRDVSSNSRGGTQLARTNVVYSTDWYETEIDWLTDNTIFVSVYDSAGALFATTSTTTSTYTTGGIGFSFWGQHGGWDLYHAREYAPTDPTALIGPEQVDSGASWKALLDTLLEDQPTNQNVRLRVQIKNSGGPITDQKFRLQVAEKGVSPNCESVSSGSYANVPAVTGGCGSSAACIYSSSQFSDHASTTDLLSVPTGFSFTPGEMVEDLSTETNNQSLATDTYSEEEYVLQMTSYASASAYCFRTTNAGTPLENYSRVAEISVLHAPSISEYHFNNDQSLALIEGATTSVLATGTVMDLNGYTDLAFATSTYYRSGLSQTCSVNDNNCYHIASTSCSFSNCSGDSCDFMCTTGIYYFADPTDVGSPYASEIWQAFTDIVDQSGARDTASSTEELLTLRAFAASTTISYGSVTVGQDTGAYNPTTTIRNTGNSILNLLVSGTDMTNASSTITAAQQRYATSSFTYSSCVGCSILSTTSVAFALDLSKPTTTAPVSTLMYWGVNVPLGTAAMHARWTKYSDRELESFS